MKTNSRFRVFYLCLLSFKIGQSQLQTLDKIEAPPGTVKISHNYYVDVMEISNLSYNEYLFWIKSVYGMDSQNYLSAYPDSSNWKDLAPEPTTFLTYFTGPAYKYYPVLCVGVVQAKAATEWRADRVMEYILVREKIIKRNKLPGIHPDSVFTIKKYFSGKYRGIRPDPDVLYYPHFELPDSSFYARLPGIADSIYAITFRYNTQVGFRNVGTWKKWE